LIPSGADGFQLCRGGSSSREFTRTTVANKFGLTKPTSRSALACRGHGPRLLRKRRLPVRVAKDGLVEFNGALRDGPDAFWTSPDDRTILTHEVGRYQRNLASMIR
jgi:hypothetical protein